MLIFKMDTASIIILFVVFCGLIDGRENIEKLQ